MRKTLLFAALAFTASAWALEKDTEGYYLIGNNADWKAFCALVNASTDPELTANGRLTADITVDGQVSQTTVGAKSDAAYKGTFDGQGHTLTFNKTGITGLGSIAPFRFIEGATIKNLRTAGSLGSNQTQMGGIVGYAKGTGNLIEGCWSSMTLTSSTNNVGGIVGMVGVNNGTDEITINNCMFSGTITCSKEGTGILGYSRVAANTTVSNCLFTGTVTATETTGSLNMRNISRANSNPTVTNCYYLNKANGTATDGIATTAEKIASGELANLLQGEQTTTAWGQANIGTPAAATAPYPTTTLADKVVKLGIHTNSGVNSVYANALGQLPSPALYNCTALCLTDVNSAPLFKAPENNADLYRNFINYALTIPEGTNAVTLILPYQTKVLPEALKAYSLEYADGLLTATELSQIDQAKPVLITGAIGDYIIENNSSRNYGWTWSNFSSTVNGALTGVFESTTAPEGSYVVEASAATPAFVKANSASIAPFSAYLTAEGATAETLYVATETTSLDVPDAELSTTDQMETALTVGVPAELIAACGDNLDNLFDITLSAELDAVFDDYKPVKASVTAADDNSGVIISLKAVNGEKKIAAGVYSAKISFKGASKYKPAELTKDVTIRPTIYSLGLSIRSYSQDGNEENVPLVMDNGGLTWSGKISVKATNVQLVTDGMTDSNLLTWYKSTPKAIPNSNNALYAALQSDEWKLYGEDFLNLQDETINALKFQQNGVNSEVYDVNFTVNDSTVGVGSIEAADDDSAWYDLAGRKVARHEKGIYIHNGKKVIVKY